MPEIQIPIQPVEDPILCSPYEEPGLHWLYDTKTGRPSKVPARREASYWYKSERTGSAQRSLLAEEERDDLPLVNALRDDVRRWRKSGWQNASETTKKLLRHWWREDRTRRLFFCQLEAAETIVYLREILAAGRKPRWKPQLAPDEFRMLEAGRNPRPDEWVARVAQASQALRCSQRGRSGVHSALCLQDGDGRRQDRGHVHAHRVGVLQPRHEARRSALSPPGAGGLSEPDDQGTPERVAARRSGQLLREVRRRALLATPRAGEGQGAGHELARPESGTRRHHGGRGAGRQAGGRNTRGVRPRPPRRSLGRRAADGAERRGTPCVSSRPGRREDEAVLRGKGGPRGSDGLGERPGPDQRRLRDRALRGSFGDALLPPRKRISRGLPLPLDRQRLQSGGRHRIGDHQDPPPPGDRQHGPPRSRVLQAVGARGEASQAGGPVAGRQAEARGRLPRGGSRAAHRSRGSGRNASIRCRRRPRGRTGPRR